MQSQNTLLLSLISISLFNCLSSQAFIGGQTFKPKELPTVKYFTTDNGLLGKADFSVGLSNICSGVFVAPKIMLTAAHCVYNQLDATLHRGVMIFISDNSQETNFKGNNLTSGSNAVIEGIYVHPSYLLDPNKVDPKRKNVEKQLLNRSDIAFIEFKNDQPFKVVQMDFAPVKVGEKVLLNGFGLKSKDDDNHDAYLGVPTLRGKIRKIDRVTNRYNCISRTLLSSKLASGDSGGPVYRISGNGRLIVVGVNVFGLNAAQWFGGGGYDAVARIDIPDVLPWIKMILSQQIRADF